MRYTIFSFIVALYLIAQPITSTNVLNIIPDTLDYISLNFSSEDDVSSEMPERQNVEFAQQGAKADEQDLELQQGIAKHLPQFFERNKEMLEKLQQGNHAAVLVIGQTGIYKQHLISALMGHKFVLQQQQITKIFEGMTMSYNQELLINKTLNAPSMGRKTAVPETALQGVYFDQQTNLAFIDTAGFVDRRQNDEAINLSNAIALRTIIEKIGVLKSILGVINYHTFSEKTDSNAFFDLLCTTGSLLKNKTLEKFSSSMVLAFTEVPENITREDVNKQLQHRCNDLIKMKESNELKGENKIVERIYNVLFPSYFNLQNKTNIPFFLISQKNLLKQGLLRKNILPIIQKATQIKSKDIGLGLTLTPHLLQTTRKWLKKTALSIAKDIRNIEKAKSNIAYIQEYLFFKEKQLLNKEELLKQLTNSNEEDRQYIKQFIIKNLQDTKENNVKRMKKLDVRIKESKTQCENKIEVVQTLNTEKVKLYKNISGSYHKKTNTYQYVYNDIPIHHILYTPHETKDEKSKNKLLALFKPSHTKNPKLNQRLSRNYKVLSITKNYKQGMLNITLENNRTYGETFAAVFTPGIGISLAKCLSPCDFQIYAQSQHIYHNKINRLIEGIGNLKKNWLQCQSERQHLQEKNESIENQYRQIKLYLFTKKNLIKQAKHQINTKSEERQKIQLDLYNSQHALNLLNRKLSNNAIIPYTITQVAPFMDFHDSCKDDINLCKQYVHTLSNSNQDNNTNSKHSGDQIGLQPNVHSFNQPIQNRENTVENHEEEQKKDHNNDNSSQSTSSSDFIPSVFISTITFLSSASLKKKN